MGARHSVARCPRWWSGAEDRSERIRPCVSEDRRSRTARSRGRHEIAVVGGADFVGWGWGAWAPKIRLGLESLISNSAPEKRRDVQVLVVGEARPGRLGLWPAVVLDGRPLR